MKVGFIGLGIMGKPMSMNLLKAGNELVVFDFNETAVAEVVAAGAKGVKSGAEVAAECDTIITRFQTHHMYVQHVLEKVELQRQQNREQL